MTTRSAMEKENFNEKRNDSFLQAGTCAWTRVVSAVPFEKEFKVQIARYKLAAWCLDLSGQCCSIFSFD